MRMIPTRLKLRASWERREDLSRNLLAGGLVRFLLSVARFPTVGTVIKMRKGTGEANTGFDTHMILPRTDAREYSSPSLNLVIREHLDIGIPLTCVLAHAFVVTLGTAQKSNESLQGEHEIRVVVWSGVMFQRVEEVGKILGAELRCQSRLLDQSYKLESNFDPVDGSRHRLFG